MAVAGLGEPTVLFDLYFVLVEVLFGSVLMAGVAMAGVITIICLLGKVSLPTLMVWIMFYIMVFMIMYVGALGLVLFFIIGFVYFAASLVRLVMTGHGS
jgi:hypothetical protein